MSMQTRNQEYPYQYKTVSASDVYFCGLTQSMELSVPADILEIKALYLRAIYQFEPSVPVARRKIHYIGGRPEWSWSGPNFYASDDQPNMVHIDQSADANRIVDLEYDFSHMIDKFPLNGGLISVVEQPFIMLHILSSLDDPQNVNGRVLLWKVDLVYTTTGIR